MKRMYEIMLAAFAVMCFATPAFAFGFGTIKGWLAGGAESVILGLIGVLLGIGVIAKYTTWISAFLTALGTLCLNAGVALNDKKLTKEEVTQFKADLAALVTAAKTKPGA